jgi:excisionase family DNA binding protein
MTTFIRPVGSMYAPSQVAELLGLSEKTIWKLVKSGKLRGIRVSPRRVKISELAVEEFLRSCPSR